MVKARHKELTIDDHWGGIDAVLDQRTAVPKIAARGGIEGVDLAPGSSSVVDYSIGGDRRNYRVGAVYTYLLLPRESQGTIGLRRERDDPMMENANIIVYIAGGVDLIEYRVVSYRSR